MAHTVETLGNTTFVLRPEYDALVLEVGGEPPVGVPAECTFEWAWDKAEQTVAKQNRNAEAKARLSKMAEAQAAKEEVKATPRKAPPRKAAARNRAK